MIVTGLESSNATIDLENAVLFLLGKFNVKHKTRNAITDYIRELENYHPLTALHSMRMGIKSPDLAAFLAIPPKPLMYSAFLHDIGKLDSPVDLLSKNGSLTPQERAVVKMHVLNGHKRLSPKFEYTAQIMVRSHFFQDDSYPLTLPLPKVTFNQKNKAIIDVAARLLEIQDNYDSRTRRNDGYADSPHNQEEIIGKYAQNHKKNIEQVALYRELLDKGVLG